MRRTIPLLAALLALACDRKPPTGPATGEDDHADHATAGASNRIDLPERVRQNLGITFAKVESRRVAATIRVPGRFEWLPSAKREYRAALPGRVEVLVKQFDKVEAGTPLFRLDSPEWHKTRLALAEAMAKVEQANHAITIAEKSRTEAEQHANIVRQRIAGLAEAQVRRAELDAELARLTNSIPRLEAEIAAKKSELHAAEHHFPILLATAASATGVATADLLAEVDAGGKKVARWETIDRIEIRAAAAGVIESFAITNGAWVDQSAPVLSVVDPAALRFRATALQADLGKIKDGAPASIVPPGAKADLAGAIPAIASLGLEASPDARTVELIVTPTKPAAWARSGVSAYAEIVTDDSVDAEPAIPLAAVVQDELARVYFRRDPKDPNKVIRVEGDFGVSDGKWVVIASGVKAGDEVVLDGVYELKLTGGGKTTGKGHFHADGTWHEAGTPEPGKK
ncbi:MAG: efflux RND transporter periplasmic adaptor subunit [Phycisphaerae bacterium]|nr:HlyD family efflux transporter periplasmic adaptor subunit [Tepidisphaeraceae bacterium]